MRLRAGVLGGDCESRNVFMDRRHSVQTPKPPAPMKVLLQYTQKNSHVSMIESHMSRYCSQMPEICHVQGVAVTTFDEGFAHDVIATRFFVFS